jgi:hypothetical protein
MEIDMTWRHRAPSVSQRIVPSPAYNVEPIPLLVVLKTVGVHFSTQKSSCSRYAMNRLFKLCRRLTTMSRPETKLCWKARAAESRARVVPCDYNNSTNFLFPDQASGDPRLDLGSDVPDVLCLNDHYFFNNSPWVQARTTCEPSSYEAVVSQYASETALLHEIVGGLIKCLSSWPRPLILIMAWALLAHPRFVTCMLACWSASRRYLAS